MAISEQIPDNEQKHFFHTLLLTLSGLTVLSAIVLTIITVLLHANDLRNYESEEIIQIQQMKTTIERSLEYVLSDLLMFSEIPFLVTYINNPTPANHTNLANAFLCAGRYRFQYDQIRYIDEHGYEVIRLQNRDDNWVQVADENLQDKSDRHYFRDTSKLSAGEIYCSPFDLNIEHDYVENKPMLRFATPVFDSTGVFRGIVILNYLGKYILEIFPDTPASAVHYWLVNRDGYWLRSNEPQQEWAFMYDDLKDVNLPAMLPAVWNAVNDSSSVRYRDSRGLFTYTIVHPLSNTHIGGVSNIDLIAWHLISWVPESTILADLFALLKPVVALGILFELFAILSAILFAHASARKKAAQDMLAIAARTDPLTGLLNRRTFSDRFRYELERAQRYERPLSLALGDIDYFKQINDTHGHLVGDEVLKNIADCIRSHLRATDIVGRWGGEEFIILLPDTSLHDAVSAIDHVRETIESSITATPQTADHITMSFGVTRYQDQADDSQQSMVKRADDALYASKNAGRNRVTAS